jgi:tetratricopeptide (TPR) repeat protein
MAQSHLVAALALRPDLPVTAMVLGDYYRSIGNYALARKYSRQAADAVPDFSWDYGTAGLDAYLMGDYEGCLEMMERRLANYALAPMQESMYQHARVVTGARSLEDYVAWGEARAQDEPIAAVGPAIALLFPRTREPVDAERVLRLLRPFAENDPDEYVGWLSLAMAGVLVGDGAEALQATIRAEELAEPRDRHQAAETSLVMAAAYRLIDDDDRADLHLRRAERIRADLTAGHEREWEGSLLSELFDQLLPIARAR